MNRHHTHRLIERRHGRPRTSTTVSAANARAACRVALAIVRRFVMFVLTLTLTIIGCSAQSSERGRTDDIDQSSESLQSNCGCSKTGAYVAQALSVPVATSALYDVIANPTNGFTTLTLKRRSDQGTVFTATAPVPTPSNPTPAVFGFSPEGDKFVYHYLERNSHTVVLVDLSTGIGRTVYNRTAPSTTTGLNFSPHGRYFVYAYLTSFRSINLNVIDTTTGSIAYAAEISIFTQALPPPGGTINVAGWGFSPDEETFVNTHVNGQGSAQWDLINVVRGRQVASARVTTSGYWAFSPCSDAIGLVEVTRQGNATVSLRRTSDGATLGNASGQALPNGVALSTTTAFHVARISNTTFQLAPNKAAAPCPLQIGSVTVSPSSVRGGQLAKGIVTLAVPAPTGGVTVALRSSNTFAATVPNNVAVTAGTTSALFLVTTNAVRIATNVTITATLGQVNKTAILQITPRLTCGGVVCADPNQCQASVSCAPGFGGCVYTPKPDGTACDDGNANTTGDACRAGTCAGIDRCLGVTCPSDQCRAGACDRTTGGCTMSNLPDGTACNDGNPSTTNDVCTSGACQGVDRCAGVTCPSTPCHVGSCEPTTGACKDTVQPDGTACDDGNSRTTNDVCTGGVCAGTPSTCVATNYALNAPAAGFPDPTQSDRGWGGGSYPWDIVDGLYSYDTWARGLAFTGGHQNGSGGPPWIEPAGIRHAVIDFGAPRTFDKIVLWWHGTEYTPDAGTIEYWDGAQWLSVGSVQRVYGTMHAEGSNSGYSDSDIYTFPAVTGSKVRYTFDNSGLNVVGTYNIHGWLYEFEVFGCSSGCDFSQDPDHCGTCSNSCPTLPHIARACTSGVCNMTCDAGFADCDGNRVTNGCETDLLNDAANCGACGVQCVGYSCPTNFSPACMAGGCGCRNDCGPPPPGSATSLRPECAL